MPEKVVEAKTPANQSQDDASAINKSWSDEQTSSFKPFVPLDVTLRELTPRALIFGVVLGVVIGASSLYLVLKTGFTISGSIVIAVSSITIFRILSKLGFRNPSILEHNIAQSAGSAGDAIAFGMGITIPAMLILGFDLSISYAVLVALIGGALGVLLMIPLRRQFIVQMHGSLKYPDAIACAKISETLVDKGGRTILFGFGLSFVYQVLRDSFKGWLDTSQKVFAAPFRAASVSIELSPILVGVGYIIGPRASSTLFAGGLLAYMVLNPLINFFGGGSPTPLAPGNWLIADLDPSSLRGAYVLYIGTGAIATAGLFSLVRSLPAIWQSLKRGLADLKGQRIVRADRVSDLRIKTVVLGLLAILLITQFVPYLHLNLVSGILIIVFGFVYVSVSARLTGEVGTSLTPLTGLTTGTLLLTCLAFLVMRWTGSIYYLTALSIGAIIGVAISTGGTASQVFKTGFLLGATPRHQQTAILIGAMIAALMLGPLLVKLNEVKTVYVSSITFEPIESEVQDIATRVDVSLLPIFKEKPGPPKAGNYRLFSNEATENVLKDLEVGEYLINDSGKVVYRVHHNFDGDLHADPRELGAYERLSGIQAQTDQNNYRLWVKGSPEKGPPGKYLVDDAGLAVYLVDPGINGVHKIRPDGSRVEKFDAPKAVLMAYIIKATLNRQLPWTLFLLGVMITLVLELCQVSSLVFAVGLYLPISSSMPIFLGGILRRLIDRRRHRRLLAGETSPLESDDQSPGVLMSAGYIAGGAIAAIVVALGTGWFTSLDNRLTEWATHHNPFFEGPTSNFLSLIPFGIMVFVLWIVARSKILPGLRK